MSMAISLCLLSRSRAGEEPAPFGFKGFEIFKASQESVGLRAVDLNGDGLMDLVYADNDDATLRLLIQVKPGDPARTVPAAAPAAAGRSGARRSINELEFDKRFRTERFFTEKKVTALAAADLDGDGKPDLAYYGDPRELEVVYQSGEWGSRREKFAIPDGLMDASALRAVDLDGDGKSDLVLLGAGKTYLIRQRSGALSKPQAIYNAFPEASSLLVGDFDGDQRPDLCLLTRGSHPFVLRFQREDGFGPEIAVKSLALHRALAAPLDGEARAGLIAIQGNTRRLRALKWGKPKESPRPALGEPRFYGFRPEGDPALRRLQLADVNGDGKADLVVSFAETAELDVYLQNARGELSPPLAFPTLAEVKSIAVGDFDGDGAPEVAVSSAREKAIGISRWQAAGGAGRLTIPETFTVEGDPLLLAVEPGSAPPPGTAAPSSSRPADRLWIVLKGADGKFHLSGRALAAGEEHREAGRGDRKLVTFIDQPFEAGAEPSGLVLFDADGDGQRDAMVFIPYEDPRLYLAEKPAPGVDAPLKLREASKGKDFGIGQISRLTPAASSLAELTDPAVHKGPALLVAQKSYARALVLEPEGKLRVLEQFSGRGAQADLAGVAALNLDDDPEKEVLLFDKADSTIQILDRSPEGTYKPVREIPLPSFEFLGFRVLDLDGDGREDVAVLGKQSIAILRRGGEAGDLEECARFDGDEDLDRSGEKGLPDLAATGDLNGDQTLDVIYASDPYSLLCFLTPAAGKSGGPLEERLSFPIFEEKSFMRGKNGQGPREMFTADMDGDRKTDVVMLIHNRILIYLQD